MPVLAVDVPPSPEVEVPKTHRRGRIIVAAALVVLGFVGVRAWFDHRLAPVRHRFGQVDSSPNFVGPAAINQQYQLGYRLPGRDLEIESVTPIVGADSAPAAIAVTVCRDAKEVFGAAPGNLQKACGSLVPARHVQLGPNDLVMVTVVPLAPGRIDVSGIHVDLRSGSRHWHEDTGPSARLLAH